MGKKKDKLKAKQEKEDEKNAEAAKKTEVNKPAADNKKKRKAEEMSTPADAAGKPQVKEEEEAVEERDERVFKASAVAFFTRDKAGKVSKVLMALEERKVSGSWIGSEKTGKFLQKMVMFPMGRREKKDKSDTVETAKREYIEETGDFGGLSQYLDFAVFDGEDLGVDMDAEKAVKEGAPWSGKGNAAVFFAPASMIVLFCEVPEGASLKTQRAAEGGVSLAEIERAKKAREEEEAKEPAGKKKKTKPAKPSPSYHIGQMDHLEPVWIDAATLRESMAQGGRAPPIQVNGEDLRIFPTCASLMRLQEARELFGMTATAADSTAK